MENNLRELALIHTWKANDGKSYNIHGMTDRHLVYTERMIYNHFLAAHGLPPIQGGKKWRFRKNRTEYILHSLLCIIYEIENYRELKPNHGLIHYEIMEHLREKFVDLNTVFIKALKDNRILRLTWKCTAADQSGTIGE